MRHGIAGGYAHTPARRALHSHHLAGLAFLVERGGLLVQHLEEGAHGGGQVAVVPPNHAEVAFCLHVGDRDDPQTPCWTSRVAAKRDTMAIPSPAMTARLTPSLPWRTSV